MEGHACLGWFIPVKELYKDEFPVWANVSSEDDSSTDLFINHKELIIDHTPKVSTLNITEIKIIDKNLGFSDGNMNRSKDFHNEWKIVPNSPYWPIEVPMDEGNKLPSP